jgi:hypothetical protein
VIASNSQRLLVAGMTAGLMALSLSAIAQTTAAPAQTGTNRAAAAAAPAAQSPVESIRMAHALIRYGDQNKDPHALITAARILQATGSSAFRGERAGGAAGATKAATDPRSVPALLQRAKAMANNRADIVAAADDVASQGTRGRDGGPARARSIVNTRSTDVYRLNFRGGERAVVLVSGDGDSDLDLFVFDENNNLVCKDDDETDDMVCAWTPRWTGQFRVEIRNLGVANEYVIATN